MFPKFSIVNICTLGLILLSLTVCESEKVNDLEIWKNRPETQLDPSVISGIRTLEYIRRLIIASSRNGRNMNSQFLLINQQNYPRYWNKGIKNERKIGNTRHPRRHVNSTMFEALSKLANIQVADPNINEHSRDENKNVNDKYLDGRLNRRQFQAPVEDEVNQDVRETVDLENTPKYESSSSERPKIFNNSNLVTRKFQCSPISEIYIPDVDKQMPAYLCTHGKKAFIISSERFNQESRDRFFISLDDKTFRRLNPVHSGTSALTSAVSVLPATLVLKRGDPDYTVRGVRDKSKSTSTTKHR